MPDDDDHQLARERSHQDAKATNDFARAMAQAAILINGGAATALLALASKHDQATVSKCALWFLVGGLAAYAAGIASGAVMVFFLHRSAQKWTIVWEGQARIKPYSNHIIDKARKRAGELRRQAYYFFYGSIACFVVGSGAVAVHLFLTGLR